VFSRRLPKTGQTISYQAGDDGDYEAGWSIGQRFIIKTIGGDQIVLDRATGLMWARDFNAAGGNNGAVITWANAIIDAEALTFAGFTDWKIPNAIEIVSIRDFATTRFQAVFLNQPPAAKQTGVWSSSTDPTLTTYTFFIQTLSGRLTLIIKTSTRNLLCCRKVF
jgi:hypothetical protein